MQAQNTFFQPTLDVLDALLPQCMLQDRVRLKRRLHRLRNQQPKAPPCDLEGLREQAARSARLLEKRRRNIPALTYPEELPISARKDEIVRALRKYPVLIVAGETGSGKTTQLPKMCLEAGRGREAKIACTQPRRVAALSLSRRLAEELGVEWGREVGCKIRFSDHSAAQTYVKMMTDGVLLAEIQGDGQLLEYDTIIVDEAHERSLNIDFLLGYLRLLRRRRPELKLIITSATIDTRAFSSAFDEAPVIEVSGRLHPVEVRYRPLEELLGAGEDCTYIDAAVRAVEEILAESRQGDVLVFMPSEHDIRETCDGLASRPLGKVEILPLFGRLSAGEQQRVFAPAPGRRIVVATNIAETSLTLPRIRWVVDTGLARLSRYNPRTQTRRLPIEPISQSSALQRRGRCGRVAAGVCIHLYSEEDFLSRPEHTQPEIQRANLAEVILRMKALGLGEVETFPFVDPPKKPAIQGGYLLLEELGALDGRRRLTPLGRDMARLPIAPTVARMVLQAQQEKALREVLVVAAAISVQDPRERPGEQREEADRMHRRFLHPHSDFLTLLNIWKAYHEQLEALRTQGKMRRFCRRHFLSYARMREWRDIHAQLTRTLGELGGFELNRQEAGYEAVHRAVLSGLLSNIAQKKEHNLYRAARGREVMLFPGSGLFQQQAKKDGEEGEKSATPPWIVAAEMVETSRLFARTAARIQPEWLLDLGRHLCRRSYRDPGWSRRAGRVLVRETTHLYGLEVAARQVPYSRVHPREATEIFIREALVGDQLCAPHEFLEHNRRVRAKIETWQTRRRRDEGVDLEEALYAFYARHLESISSVHELNRLLRRQRSADARFLFVDEEELLGRRNLELDREAFPDALVFDGEALPLSYAYHPGREDDGVTVELPGALLEAIDPEVLEWLVPGLLEEKITCLLRSLPKRLRKPLVPIPDRAREIAAELRPTHSSFLAALEAFLRKRYGLQVRRSDWNPALVPPYLRMRVEVQGGGGTPLLAGRDLSLLNARLKEHDTPVETQAWKQAAARWERAGLSRWDFGDLPERLEVTALSGVPLHAYPGLEAGDEEVALRLFKNRAAAAAASRKGRVRLCELELKEELDRLRRQLRDLERFAELYRAWIHPADLQRHALEHLEGHLFAREPLYPLTRARFEEDLEQAKNRLEGLAPRFVEQVGRLLEIRRRIRLYPHSYPDMPADMERLMPADFLLHIPFARLRHLERYLRAVLVRAERAHLNPAKDAHKAARVRPYQEKLEELLGQEWSPQAGRARLEELRWMVEEFRVSVFAQELGTAQPISPGRLDEKIAAIQSL